MSFFSKKVDEKLKIESINRNENKNIVKNIVFVAFSNVLSLLSGILVGFILPKIMSKADYGFYKTFTLYFTYLGLFPMGFIDGIYLYFAGKKFDELDKEKFRLYTQFVFGYQFLISILLVVISLPIIQSDYGFILLMLGINVVFNSMIGYYQIISQITGRFKELSFRNVIKAILTSLSIGILTLLFYFDILSIVSYGLYIAIFTIIQIILAIWYIFTYRKITFGKKTPIGELKKEILFLFKIGFPLLIANLVSSFILTIDRQFVSLLFDIETYASYAFAYNMLSLITTVITAISTVLYPTIKVYSFEKLTDNYNRLIAIIAIFVAFSLCSYYPLEFILNKFLPNYLDSLPIFRIILPGLLLTSCISTIMFNYYKAINKQFLYFIISLIIFVLSILFNILAYIFFETPISISIASIITMIIWYFVVEFFILKTFKIRTWKNLLYLLIIIVAFYLISGLIDNLYVGFAIYTFVYFLVTFIFYHKLIFAKFKKI